MKKSLIVVGVVILVLLVAALALPAIFKNDIKRIVDRQIEQSVKAKVSYQDFDLSLISGFPNLQLSVENISVVGLGEFEGDTLFSADNFAIKVNPFQALFSDNLNIRSITSQRPRVTVLVAESGAANYDISADTSSTDTEPSSYQFGIDHWSLQDATIVYHDEQTGFYLELRELNHEGSGDFTQDLFDLETSSQAQLVAMSYDGVEYISDKKLVAEVILEMNLPESKYTFKDNQVSINDFAFGFEGWVSMPENSEDLLLDISFETRENSFQNLLSCVPGMYREGFEDIKSEGLVTFNGMAKGIYNEDKIPAFRLALQVEDAMFQYPDLPTAVSDINIDLLLANEDGNLDNTLIDISKLHLAFGSNPVNGSLKVDGLTNPEVNADITARLDLGELTSMFPLEGTTLKGNYNLSLKADGTYDSINQTFPVVDASMELRNGYIKSQEFPESLEQFQFVSRVSNQTGRLPDTRIEVPEFSFVMDQEPVSGHMVLTNPDDYTWDFSLEGGVDLAKLTHILSLEDMTLAGVIRGNLASSGKMSSLEAEKYADIPTSGSFEVEDFSYASQDLAYPFQIKRGKASFTPRQIEITQVEALTGSTDLKAEGVLTNYINYIFGENESINGTLELKSNKIDLNEWMTEAESESGEEGETLTVLEIPTNVNMNLQANAGTVLYDNMTLTNARGQIIVKDGVAELRNLSFNSLGGGFLISGIYDPRNVRHPIFNMDLQIQEVAFKEAFQTFNTVKVLAPIAQFVDGDFSTNFKINGALQQNMMPNLSTLNGNGLVNVVTAALSGTDSKLVQGLAGLTQFNSAPKQFKLEDVIMAIKIRNGQMDVAPFEASFGDYRTEISGSTGIDGNMNFNLNMEVPAGVVGTSVNQAIATLSGSDKEVDDKINLNLKLAGSYTNPNFSLGSQEGTTAGVAKSVAQQKKQEVEDSAKVLVEQQKQQLTQSAKQQLDSLISNSTEDSAAAEGIKEVAKELLDDENLEGVLNLFKKKKKDTTKTP